MKLSTLAASSATAGGGRLNGNRGRTSDENDDDDESAVRSFPISGSFNEKSKQRRSRSSHIVPFHSRRDDDAVVGSD